MDIERCCERDSSDEEEERIERVGRKHEKGRYRKGFVDSRKNQVDE